MPKPGASKGDSGHARRAVLAGEGQENPETGAGTDDTLDLDFSAMVVHDRFDDRGGEAGVTSSRTPCGPPRTQ